MTKRVLGVLALLLLFQGAWRAFDGVETNYQLREAPWNVSRYGPYKGYGAVPLSIAEQYRCEQFIVRDGDIVSSTSGNLSTKGKCDVWDASNWSCEIDWGPYTEYQSMSRGALEIRRSDWSVEQEIKENEFIDVGWLRYTIEGCQDNWASTRGDSVGRAIALVYCPITFFLTPAGCP